MCEVFLQGGNVRLETSNSESKTYRFNVCDYVSWLSVRTLIPVMRSSRVWGKYPTNTEEGPGPLNSTL